MSKCPKCPNVNLSSQIGAGSQRTGITVKVCDSSRSCSDLRWRKFGALSKQKMGARIIAPSNTGLCRKNFLKKSWQKKNFFKIFFDLYIRPYVYFATHRSAIWPKSRYILIIFSSFQIGYVITYLTDIFE